MLHDVKINANKHTNVAKQGRFINVVLAAGVIEARISLTDNQTFQTSLVSGMAFPVPQGFKSVSFSAESSQQAKVWLSDLPLTYSPIESKSVGSSSLDSSTAKTYFGEITPLLPAQSGRGKVTIYPQNDIFIGGAGLSAVNAIKVSAGQSFELSTQGEVNAFTKDANYSPVFASKVSASATYEKGVIKGFYPQGAATSSALDSQSSVYIVDSVGKVRRVTLSDFENTIVNSEKPCRDGQLSSGNKFYCITTDNANINMLEVDMVSHIAKETLIATHDNQIDYPIWQSQTADKIFFSVWDAAQGNPLYFGTKDAPQLITSPTTESYLNFLWMLSDESLVACYGSTTYFSLDSGDTWSAGSAVPSQFTVGPPMWKMDETDNSIYVVSHGTKIHRSIDRGVTWELVYLSTGQITTYDVVGGVISVNTIGLFVQIGIDSSNKIEISHNGENTDAKVIVTAPNGSTYLGYSGGFSEISGEKVLHGGLDVAVMAEVN